VQNPNKVQPSLLIIDQMKKLIKWFYGGSGKNSLVIYFIYGLIITWIVKNGLTQLFFFGKSFSGRSFAFQILFVFIISLLFMHLLILTGRLIKPDRYQKTAGSIDQSIGRFTSNKWFFRILLIIFILILIISAVQLLTSLTPQTNDDVFVYYNYARNFVEGRPFAYDTRNIPSEGFTSLLYLLLLIPFEFFKINMTFASTFINLAAIVGIIIALGKLISKTKTLSKESNYLLLAFITFTISIDVNVRSSLQWGLETMLGVLVLILAGLSLAYSFTLKSNSRGINSFFIFMFLAYIIRPESMVFTAIIGLPILLINKTSRKKTFINLLIFSGVIILFHVLKYLVFGDVVPTGFYRKVSSGSGYNYVWEWAIFYKNWIFSSFVALFTVFIFSWKKTRWSLFTSQWFYFLIGVSMAILLFFTQIRPLAGTGYRFLMTPIITLYFSLGLLTLWLFDQLISFANLKKLLIICVLLFMAVYSGIKIAPLMNNDLISKLNILSRSESATNEHKYLQFGKFLRESFSKPEDITLVFGDAGAIPYSMAGRFVDSNGLTEPAIARLFLMPDGPQKTQAYIDYVLSQHPDIVVLGDVGEMDASGVWHNAANVNSPFRGAQPMEVYKAYLDYGIVYCCSAHLYYDIHIGISSRSPYYQEIKKALLSYCAEDGFILPNGFTVSDGKEEITFPPGP